MGAGAVTGLEGKMRSAHRVGTNICLTTGAAGTGGVGGAGAGDPTELVTTGAGGSGAGGAGAGGAGVVGSGAGGGGAGGIDAGGAGGGGAGVGGTGAGGAGAGGAGAVDPGGTVRLRPYFVPLLQLVLRVLSSTGFSPPLLCPPPDQSQLPLQPASPLPAPSYTKQSGSLTKRREPTSHPASPVRTACRVPRSRPPPVPGTHTVTLCPSSVLLRVPLRAPPESSLPEVPEPESDRPRAASPTVSRLLATAVTGPSFESAAASALIAEQLDFAAACRLDYATALVVESESASPLSVEGECALGTNVLRDRQEEFECLAAAVPRFASMLLAPEGDPDAPDILTSRSYAEAITGILEVHRHLRRQVAALGFAPSTADPSLFLRINTLLPPFYILVYLGLQITRNRARRTITLTQSHMVHQVLQRFGFQFSLPQLTPLSTDHSLSAPPLDESVDSSGPYPELVGCLMYLMTCTGPDLTYPLSLLARYVALGRHRKDLCWLTYLLTDLGEQLRSPPVLYVDNKAMNALCQEHRLEHRTKHIALRYFLARELQQRGQLRLAYVATRANTADVFIKALAPGDHQRFATVLGIVPTLPHLLTA
ncbi:unnamed protein product [Closterium sp. NIES-54]